MPTMTNVEARAKKASERRDKLVNRKKHTGKTKGTVMSEDQKKLSPKDRMGKMYERRRHP